jgi:Kef-type K+ transport system membrane component KefB
MGGLFRRLDQPAVVGEMAAGLMLGPSLFGWIAPEGAAFLFPPASLGLLNAVSQFGIVLFMFIVGSRLESGHLLRHSRTVLQTSVVSMLLPFGLGAGLGYVIGPQFSVQESRLLPFVLFVGLSLSITAFPVLVRIVAEHDLTTTRLGTIAVACAAFDDATAWVALAFVSSLASTGSASIGASLGWLAAYALAFAFTGLRTNVYLLDSPGLALLSVVILIIAILGKASGPFLSGRKLKFSKRETMALGVLLNARGLVELVVLNIGLEIGLLPPPLFAMLTLMALITTAMTSPLLSRLGYKRQANRQLQT